jgi:hypothetical protein
MNTSQLFTSLAKPAALSLILAMAGTILAPQAFAAGLFDNRGTPEQQRACRPDVLRHCRGIDDTYAIEQCLRAKMPQLRPACRHVFGGA